MSWEMFYNNKKGMPWPLETFFPCFYIRLNQIFNLDSFELQWFCLILLSDSQWPDVILENCHRNSRVHALQGIVRTWDRFTDRKRKGKLGNRLEKRGSAHHFAGASENLLFAFFFFFSYLHLFVINVFT